MTERERGEEIQITPERGRTGGAAPAAAMPAIAVPLIRWSAIWAGVLIAIATQMLLNALGLGLRLYGFTPTGAAFGNPAVWNGIWALIALFIGGFVAARLAASTDAANGAWHGVIVWALTLTLGLLLAAFGIAGVLGAIPAGMLTTRAAPLAGMTTGAAWGFLIVSLLGLAAAAWGGSLGRNRGGG